MKDSPLPLLCTLLLLLTACASQPSTQATSVPPLDSKRPAPQEEMTIYLADHTAKCPEDASLDCLLYRSDPQGDYEPFQDTIEGLTYVPGFTYELRVLRTVVENPPVDGSLYDWRLIEVIQQAPTAIEVLSGAGSLIGPTWGWVQTTVGEAVFASNGPARYTLQFHENGSYAALLDCNRMSGSYTLEADGTLHLTLGPTTRMGCPPDSQDSVYAGYLENAISLRVLTDGLEIELKDEGGTMSFVSLD
ncbi:MAG: DUF4377 domain-containing protein [Ardenticatenales bacterium]|nr:DUF4377 domain-containing protein [Ardenticatenales bacterium]